jgi:hypothetical protein
MEHVIRTAHHFVNSTQVVPELAQTYHSVADALNRMSDLVTQAAKDFLSKPIDAIADGHRVRAGIDFDTDNPGLWIDKVGICTVDMNAPTNTKRRTKRRFSSENEEKRAQKKIAKLKEDLQKAGNKEKHPTKKRKTKEDKSKGEDDVPPDKASGDDCSVHASADAKVLQEHADAADFEISENSMACATYHFNHSSLQRHMLRFRRLVGRLTGKTADVGEMVSSTIQVVKKISGDVATPPSIASGHRFFANPVSFVRSYASLEIVDLHPALRAPMLSCERTEPIVATDGLMMVQNAANVLRHITMLTKLPATGPKSLRRILVCAATNAVVDHMWEEYIEQPQHKLCMLRTTQAGRAAMEHQPAKRIHNYRGKMIVFATIAGRNSHQLQQINFDAIVLLGAESVPEYDTWALLRAPTRHLCLVSSGQSNVESSTFHRLARARYPESLL